MSKTQIIEKIERLPCGPLLAFAVKQGWAALFGGLLLLAIIITSYADLPFLSQYDWLFMIAIGIQAFMLLAKLEKPYEVITIVLFHLVGLCMELFKTSDQIGSWSYPGDAIFMIGNVPLFSGFMYAAVGSYIARSWRVLDLSFSNYPNRAATVLLAVAIYVNFFTHHFFFDFRYVLFAVMFALYFRTWVSYKVNKTVRRMPILVGLLLITIFIWIAENVGTFTNVWLYPHQAAAWELVGIEKIGSWLLLMVISFIMVDILHYMRRRN